MLKHLRCDEVTKLFDQNYLTLTTKPINASAGIWASIGKPDYSEVNNFIFRHYANKHIKMKLYTKLTYLYSSGYHKIRNACKTVSCFNLKKFCCMYKPGPWNFSPRQFKLQLLLSESHFVWTMGSFGCYVTFQNYYNLWNCMSNFGGL